MGNGGVNPSSAGGISDRDTALSVLSKVITALPAGVIAVDAEGNVLVGNEFVRELTVGADPTDFSALLFRHGDGRPYREDERPLLQVLRSGQPVLGRELDVLDADGRYRVLLANAVPIPDDEGGPGLVVAAYFDITLQKEAEARAAAELERQRALLHTLRSSLLPPHLIEVPGARMAARYRAATEEIGGDFYDMFPLGPETFGLSIGDVCGQGTEAAVITSLIRYTLRGAALTTGTPGEALAMVNRTLLEAATERFCTAIFAQVRPTADALTLCIGRAGHPFPIIRRASGEVTLLRTEGSLLGVMERPDITDVPVVLAHGDLVAFVTDGVTEARRADGSQLGHRGVVRLLQQMPLDAGAEDVADALASAAGQHGAADDVAIVVLESVP